MIARAEALSGLLRGRDGFEFSYRGGALPWLSVGKFVCALMVIMIHTDCFAKMAVLPVCRFAVPFFFMVSGFFLCDSDGSLSPRKVATVLKKMVVVTVGLQILYFFVRNAQLYLSDPDGFVWHFWPSLKFWLLNALHGGILGAHLWYMNAYVWALVVVWLVAAVARPRLLYVFVVPGLVANLLFGSYLVWGDEPDAGLVRNAFVTALPFVAIGVFIRRNQWVVMSPRRSLLLLLAGLPLLYAESIAISHGGEPLGDINIVTIPLSVLFFMALLAMPAPTAPRLLSLGGQRLSPHIYYYHYGIVKLLDLLIPDTVIAAAGWFIYTPLSVGLAWLVSGPFRRSADKVAKSLPDDHRRV